MNDFGRSTRQSLEELTLLQPERSGRLLLRFRRGDAAAGVRTQPRPARSAGPARGLRLIHRRAGLDLLPRADPADGRARTTGSADRVVQQTSRRYRRRRSVSPSPPVGPDRKPAGSSTFTCDTPRVTDGDTVRCGPLRVRLASNDAPELRPLPRRPHLHTGDPWASSDHLLQLISNRPLSCQRVDTDRYGRTVAFCSVGGTDLSCAQVTSGHAVIRYGELSCGSR